MFKFIYLLALFTVGVSVYAQEDLNSTEENYIDAFHKRVSSRVINTSKYLDDRLSGYVTDENATELDLSEVLEEEVSSVDQFFQNDKFLDETDKSFVRIRLDTNLNSKEDDDFNLKMSAQIPLNKSKRSMKLFISDIDQDNAKDIIADDTKGQKNAPEIGMNYFAPESYGIASRYSLGLRGMYPFVRARYSKVYSPGQWLIEPTQYFRYSTKNDFEEETSIYFDTKPIDLTLFRIQLSRGTKSREDGMNYSLGISYFWSPIPKAGLNVLQTFQGNTKYKYTVDDNVDPIIESPTYGGIYNYGSSMSWRHNVWKKWFFYELSPGVNFHRQYDYKANYSMRIYLDFFFGDF